MIEALTITVPEHVVPRETSSRVAQFKKLTGIKKTRRWSGVIGLHHMVTAAAHSPIHNVDNLIVVTQSPDQFSPCMAIMLHEALGLSKDVLAFDVNHACDGWVVGVRLANKLGGRSMLVCYDQLRYGKDVPENLIFSDAVSVTIVDAGFDAFASMTDGSFAKKLYCGLDGEMMMDGNAVFDYVTTEVPKFIKSMGPYDYLVPHQANLMMNKIIEKRSGYEGRTVYSIEEYGNQSMNSIPTAIAHNEQTLFGKNILACGFGAGFSAAAIGLYWKPKYPSKIVEV